MLYRAFVAAGHERFKVAGFGAFQLKRGHRLPLAVGEGTQAGIGRACGGAGFMVQRPHHAAHELVTQYVDEKPLQKRGPNRLFLDLPQTALELQRPLGNGLAVRVRQRLRRKAGFDQLGAEQRLGKEVARHGLILSYVDKVTWLGLIAWWPVFGDVPLFVFQWVQESDVKIRQHAKKQCFDRALYQACYKFFWVS